MQNWCQKWLFLEEICQNKFKPNYSTKIDVRYVKIPSWGPTISETQGYLGWDLNSITVDTWPSDFWQWIDQVYMLDRWNGQIFHFSMILGGAFSVQASFQGFFLCLNWHIIYLWGGTCYIWLQMIAREDFSLDFIPTLVPRWYLMPGWTLKRIQGKQKSIKNQSKLVHT